MDVKHRRSLSEDHVCVRCHMMPCQIIEKAIFAPLSRLMMDPHVTSMA